MFNDNLFALNLLLIFSNLMFMVYVFGICKWTEEVSDISKDNGF